MGSSRGWPKGEEAQGRRWSTQAERKGSRSPHWRSCIRQEKQSVRCQGHGEDSGNLAELCEQAEDGRRRKGEVEEKKTKSAEEQNL